jgi:hypothetical protein
MATGVVGGDPHIINTKGKKLHIINSSESNLLETEDFKVIGYSKPLDSSYSFVMRYNEKTNEEIKIILNEKNRAKGNYLNKILIYDKINDCENVVNLSTKMEMEKNNIDEKRIEQFKKQNNDKWGIKSFDGKRRFPKSSYFGETNFRLNGNSYRIEINIKSDIYWQPQNITSFYIKGKPKMLKGEVV